MDKSYTEIILRYIFRRLLKQGNQANGMKVINTVLFETLREEYSEDTDYSLREFMRENMEEYFNKRIK